MKKLVALLVLNLFITIPCSSQIISNDSAYVMTAEELKYVNLIFAEHEYLTNKTSLLETEISKLEELNKTLEKIDSINTQKILKQETTIKKLKKSNKIKNNVIIGSMIGYFALLLVIL